MRRHVFWLIALPLVLAGIECAHALGNLLADSESGELFSSPASGGNALPLVAATLAAAVCSALVARARGGWWMSRRSRLVALPFAVLPPVGFMLLELVEGIARPGAVSAGVVFDRAFAIGFALQLPVALVGYALARLLLRAADAVWAAQAAPAPRLPRLAAKHSPAIATVAAPRPVVDCSRGRAPPRVLALG